MRLRAPGLAPIPCKICKAPAPLLGGVDFGRSCRDGRGRVDPVTGQAVYYRRCEGCGLIFTDAFDDWSREDFAREIYNDRYVEADPDYAEVRPMGSRDLVAHLFGASKGQFSILDYGAGNGAFARLMAEAGFGEVVSYDPIHPEFGARPKKRFDLVTCFETLEHVPDPVASAKDLASLVAEDGMILISTLVQPADIATLGVDWWYLGPRNGHITLYSDRALDHLWRKLGFTFGSFSEAFHLAYRRLPWFAAHLTERQAEAAAKTA